MDRLRWDNIARAAAVLAVVALIVAWPHLGSRDPVVPSAAPTPVSVEQTATFVLEAPLDQWEAAKKELAAAITIG